MPEIIRGQYEILGEIGKGGMGQVLKAKDTKLNRMVALKVLRSDQRADDERKRRFYLEAQAASALNHPNIITIYDIVTEGEHDYMVMEFVQGKTLGDLIPGQGLNVKQVIAYGVQMADALATAHGAGIVHRDLKPGNAMVTDKGLVKILDFGLAKLEAPLPDDDPEAMQMAPMTREGFILGTCAYMSPEQAQGKPVDSRSDIFSFGAVLYEMATGKRAFSGENNITTLSAVLRDEPRSMMELLPNIPTPLERLIHRCLRKDQSERWQTMEEVRGALAALKQSSDSGILERYSEDPTVAMQAPVLGPAPISGMQSGQEGPSPFAAAPAGAGTAGAKKGPKIPPITWALVGAAAIAAFIFGPGKDDEPSRNRAVERREREAAKEEIKKDAKLIEAEVKAKLKDALGGIVTIVDMENDDVLKMLKAKVPENTILSQMKNSQTEFDLSSEAVIVLVKTGATERLIEGMRNPKKINLQAGATGAPVVPGVPEPPPEPAKAPAGAVPIVLADGTPMRLLLSADIANEVPEGTPLAFTVADDFRVGDAVVVPKGAPARGAVMDRRRKRFIRGSRVMYQVSDVDGMGGAKIRLRAVPLPKPDEGNARPMDFPSGRTKELLAKQGTEFIAYVDGEQKLFAPVAAAKGKK